MAKGAGTGPRFELKIAEKVSNLRGSLHSVLVVDDDNSWLTRLAECLPPVDQVVTATDYRTAVEKVLHQSFNLIVVDLRLVDWDDSNLQGIGLIRLVREKDKERGTFTQIVIVSAFYPTKLIREVYMTFNIRHHFAKTSFCPSEYRSAIKEALT